MYEQYWQLRERPFDSQADARFFCQSQSQTLLLDKLRFALVERAGCVLLCGQAGVGKTALTRTFIRTEQRRFTRTLWLGAPFYDHADLLRRLDQQLRPQSIPTDLQRQNSIAERPAQYLERICEVLQATTGNVLIVLDAATQLTDPTSWSLLKALHEWGPQAEEQAADLQVSLLLLATPEAMQTTQTTPSLSGLTESLTMRLMQESFTRTDVAAYLAHRLEVAGAKRNLFSEAASDQILLLTHGLPRKINQLADLSLLAGYVRRTEFVDVPEVLEAARELLLEAA